MLVLVAFYVNVLNAYRVALSSFCSNCGIKVVVVVCRVIWSFDNTISHGCEVCDHAAVVAVALKQL